MQGGIEMDLVLWRHAEAQEWVVGCDDMARALTSRGEKQAAKMARWLDRQLPEDTLVLVSPACRCEQTVMALGRKYKVRPELGPDCNVTRLLKLVQWPSAKPTVLVVGHQPVLGQTVARLIGLDAGECSVKKGAVWWLRNQERAADDHALVVAVQSPELL